MTSAEALVWRKCTPFCEKSSECPEHHELLQAIVNCTDQLGHLSNLEILKSCVEKYESHGWNKNDDIPDPVIGNRYPLIHWAASLGKCNAMEWMINCGFDPTVTVSGVGENAMHRAVLCLYKSRQKFTMKELRPKFVRIVALLSNLLSLSDTVNRDTPLHTAATMLLNTDVKVNFFQTAIEVMAHHTRKMNEAERTRILDAKNDDGDTALHILAGVNERSKVDYACVAITALLESGADKTVRNNNGQTPLDIAVSRGFDKIIEELVKIVCPISVSYNELPHDMTNRSSPVTFVNLRNRDYKPSSPRTEGFSYVPNDDIPIVLPEDAPSSIDSGIEIHRPEISRASLHVKQEPDEDENGQSSNFDQAENFNGGAESPLSASPGAASDSAADDLSSPLLKHLQQAGLLSEVSSLLVRAKSRDENQLRRLQQQAKDLDTQIRFKLAEIEKIRQDVSHLRTKRKKCDDEAIHLRKRLASCSHAMKEIPASEASTPTHTQISHTIPHVASLVTGHSVSQAVSHVLPHSVTHTPIHQAGQP